MITWIIVDRYIRPVGITCDDVFGLLRIIRLHPVQRYGHTLIGFSTHEVGSDLL